MSEDEIDQLLNSHVPAQVNTDLQCAPGQEGDGGNFSSSEKDDSPVGSFIDQQAKDFHMDGNDDRRSFVSDLVEIKDDTQENDVPISDNGDGKSDQEIDGEEEKGSCMVEAASNGEKRGTYLTDLISLELDLHEEVAHSLYEQRDEIFVQISEKSLGEFMVDDINDYVGFQESFEVSFLMFDECKDNLAVISYEDDLQYIQTSADQTIQDSLSDSSSYVSCFEMFFEEEICSPICSEFFEDQENTLIYEERPESREKDTLFFQHEEILHVFQDPIADLLQSAVKVIIAVFSDEGDHGQLCFCRLSYQYLLFTRRSNPENQLRRHLLDWLHWKTHYT